TSASTLIASGGSRGDFVAVDPNGTLLLTQIDRIQRLTAPQGGGFGQTPEPGTLAMIGGMGAFGGLFLVRRRRK
ncbi:MAG: PEP-CTERM sorting domain-containing protein, partial [Chthonomonadales bacterium]